MKKILLLLLSTLFILYSCSADEELDMDELDARLEKSRNQILSRTVSRPSSGEYQTGVSGGTWYSSITSDPKTFNTLTARDADSRTVIDVLYPSLADYDVHKREFIPNIAEFRVETDKKNDRLKVYYTLRDDLYWTSPASSEKIKVTSDDAVFWYNEIDGDQTLQQPGYPGQFVTMKDGSLKRITIEKIDSRTFVFNYPRIVDNPILSTNMSFGPMAVFSEAKKKGGNEALKNLYTVDTDVKTILSMGRFHIKEYNPGIRIVLSKNPHFFKKDKAGETLPYMEEVIYKVVPDVNTSMLLFKKGETDAYSLRPEDLDDLVKKQKHYTVYNGGASQGATFITFNQKPGVIDEKYTRWFSSTEFRQAMSCMLNRERIVKQVYRGLGEAMLHFFADFNPYFDSEIKNEFTYNPERALELLKKAGMERDSAGVMRDSSGNAVEFNMGMGIENNIGSDIAVIYADELKKIGIKLNVRPVDFQKLVDSIMNTYDWHSVMVGLGALWWPTSGSNVWKSDGNFHLWNPLQKKPATAWEARIDYLYNEGSFATDRAEAKKIWDEYQKIILTQLPVIYLVRPYSFLAVKNRWDNVFYDTLNGLETEYLFLRQAK